MSYSKDLEEYSDEVLRAELQRRQIEREQGKCSYCGKEMDTYDKKSANPCRYHETFVGSWGTTHIQVKRREG
jgi:hypothetical protein